MSSVLLMKRYIQKFSCEEREILIGVLKICVNSDILHWDNLLLNDVFLLEWRCICEGLGISNQILLSMLLELSMPSLVLNNASKTTGKFFEQQGEITLTERSCGLAVQVEHCDFSQDPASVCTLLLCNSLGVMGDDDENISR